MLIKNSILFHDFKGFLKLPWVEFSHQFLSFLLVLFVHVFWRVVSSPNVENRQFNWANTLVLILTLFFCQNFLFSNIWRVNYRHLTWNLWIYWNVIIHTHFFLLLKVFNNCPWLLSISYPLFSFCCTFFLQISLYNEFWIWSVMFSDWKKLWTFLLLWIFACLIICSHLMKPFPIIWIHSQCIQQIVSLNRMTNCKVFRKCL